MTLIKRGEKGSALTYNELDGNFTHLGGDGSYEFPSTDGAFGQVLVTDGSGNLAFAYVTSDNVQGGLTRDDFSATTASPPTGGGSLTYNNLTGTFTFTPAYVPTDLSEFSDNTNLLFSKSYNDLTDLPQDLATTAYVQSELAPYQLSAEAFSGSYNDLSNVPNNLATTTYVTDQINTLVDYAPAALNSLNELAAALGDDPNFATTVATRINAKLDASAFEQRFNNSFGNKTTDDLSEGTNKYYTDQKVQDKLGNITGSLVPDLDRAYDIGANGLRFRGLWLSGSTIYLGDVKISADTDGVKFLNFSDAPQPIVADSIKLGSDSGTILSIDGDGKFTVNTSTGDPVSVDLTNNTTSDLAEGSNLYYTEDRVNTKIIGTVTKAFVDNLNVNASKLDGIDSTGFATAAQGETADTALQPGDNISQLINNSNYITYADLKTGGDLQYDSTTGTYSVTTYKSSNFANDLGNSTTDQLNEGVTNLYYQDTRVASYLNSNNYMTQLAVATYLNNNNYIQQTDLASAINNLVDAAPTTLDTLNELAAALGDDPNFATTITTAISAKANTADLATVATTGSYNDLTNKPFIPTDVSNLTDTTNRFFSRSYNDLTNKPTLFSGSYDDLTDKPFIPTDVSNLTDTTNLLDHFSGSYNDLTNKPFIPTDADDLTDANGRFFSGNYNDLTNLPNLFSGSYNDLTNKPFIPSNTSELNNDAGFISGYTVTQSDVTQHEAALRITESQITDLKSYLVASDIASLASTTYVDNAIDALVDTAPGTLDTLNELAAALGDDPNFAVTISNQLANKPDTSSLAQVAFTGSYNNLLNQPFIPSDLSQITDTAGLLFSGDYADLNNTPFIPSDVVHLSDSSNLLFSKSYNDLTDKPIIPTRTSELVNDRAFISGYYVTENDVRAHEDRFRITESQITDLKNYLLPGDIDLSPYATTTYVDSQVSNITQGASEALDTLRELAAALGDDPNFASTVTSQLAAKADTTSLSAVATSGSYDDLANTPAQKFSFMFVSNLRTPIEAQARYYPDEDITIEKIVTNISSPAESQDININIIKNGASVQNFSVLIGEYKTSVVSNITLTTEDYLSVSVPAGDGSDMSVTLYYR